MNCWFRGLALIATGLYVGVPATMGAVRQPGVEYGQEAHFPMPKAVQNQVRFWEKVFGKYNSTTLIIHDAELPNRIVDFIDFTEFAATDNGMANKKDRDNIGRNYVARYQLAVTRFTKYGREALKFGAIEKRVFKVFGRHPDWVNDLYNGRVTFRAQRGLADDFLNATALAQAYLPFMERVFRDAGVPTRVTRLAFVESMFNTKAKSKVGASGVWQFMPATARSYVHVDALVDERNSVYKATHAAALLLRDNYKLLGSWPLAITAYNHGPKGLQSAVRKLGSRDIGKIISNYSSKSFGFASRNFYAEFLAAANVFDDILQTGRAKSAVTLPKTRSLVLNEPISIDRLIKQTPLDENDVRVHNPCLRSVAFGKFRHKTLPKRYELHVPAHMEQAVISALDERSKTYARR